MVSVIRYLSLENLKYVGGMEGSCSDMTHGGVGYLESKK
jgi:hypothetical protein